MWLIHLHKSYFQFLEPNSQMLVEYYLNYLGIHRKIHNGYFLSMQFARFAIARECPKILWYLLFSSSSSSLLAPYFIPAYPVVSYPFPPTVVLLLACPH